MTILKPGVLAIFGLGSGSQDRLQKWENRLWAAVTSVTFPRSLSLPVLDRYYVPTCLGRRPIADGPSKPRSTG